MKLVGPARGELSRSESFAKMRDCPPHPKLDYFPTREMRDRARSLYAVHSRGIVCCIPKIAVLSGIYWHLGALDNPRRNKSLLLEILPPVHDNTFYHWMTRMSDVYFDELHRVTPGNED